MISIGAGIIAWIEEDDFIVRAATRLQRGLFLASAAMCVVALVLVTAAG
jgi:hypothetical protein